MTRARARTRHSTARSAPSDTPTGDSLLARAVEEAAHLLNADGAMVYLVDPGSHRLRFACDAGIRDPEARELIRTLSLPVGVGLFGHAIGTGEVVVSGDYREDRRFEHSPVADRIVASANMRSMAAAPLVAEGEVLGALGAYSSRVDDFSEAEVALLRSLADHAAAAIANQRLIEELARSKEELARRVETNARLTEELERSREQFRYLVDESVDIMWSIDAEMRFTYISDSVERMTGFRPDELIGQHVSMATAPESMELVARAFAEMRQHPRRVYRLRILEPRKDGSMLPVEIRGTGIVDAEGTLIGAHGTNRDITEIARLERELRDQAEELAHRVEAQRTLGEIAASITSIRDPSAVLNRAVAEAKRLLDAEHVAIHQVRGGSHELADFRETSDDAAPRQAPFDDSVVKIGQGVAGRAVAGASVTWTGDYLADASFTHTARADEWITRNGYRSQMSAPLVGESGPLGAISAYSQRANAFDADDAGLLGALASHAAIVLGNARLYEELERRVEAQRSLGEIAARISAIREPGDVLQRTLDEAVRLLDADGGRIELVAENGGLHWALGHSAIDLPIERDEAIDPVVADEGVSGRAVLERRVISTGDYLADQSIKHVPASDGYIRRHGIRSVMSAPLIAEEGAIGSLTIHSQARQAFGTADAELLEVLASQAAIAVTNARLYEQLGEESSALARQTDSQRRLLQINERLLSTLESADVLELVADGLKGVVWYDNLGLYRVVPSHDVLEPVLARDRNAEAVMDFQIPKGSGLTWWTVEHRQPVLLNQAHDDPRLIQIPNTPPEEEAIIIVPLISGDDVIGALNISRTGGPEVAFTDADFELVQLFAAQAAVAITNARLYDELRERSDAQRTLAEIAAQIASLHDPVTVIQRAVADAARLLRADRAQVNLVSDDGSHLDPPIAAAPGLPSPDDVIVPIGSGIAGLAASQRLAHRTGDYLNDEAFPHDAGDVRIEAQGVRSMMSAPLLGPDRLIGTITVQSNALNAFDAEDAELISVLADQVAIALTNARLYAEVEESERRYRHLVDNSPDIVWSVDVAGRFTFFSDSLEGRTGWKPEQLLGQPFTMLGGPETIAAAGAAWQQLQDEPEREQRLRLELPLPDGRMSQAEVAMTGTIVDGRFAGAHGSVRDISERERLEGDLRSQAAELAASQERAHLARELHDSVTQALFSIGLTLRSLELLMTSNPEAAQGKLVELRELQKDALAEMRTLIFELRPSSLEADGLVQALRTHATAVQRRTGLAIVVDAEPIDRLELSAEEALYRIGQEALHNVVKHANASNVRLQVVVGGDVVRLTVTDDGVGFDPDVVPRGHLGLIGMRQRIDLVGGELRVDSKPGSGTVVEASVPYTAVASAE
ncbi:MAG: GAF domain-containing protein [Candidatus Limnocylindria bacterium]